MTRLLCCSLLCAAALPAFAQEAASVPAATAASATGTAAMAETAASSILAAPVVSDAMPMPERAMMFAGDINRLIGSRPLAATASEPSTGGRIQSVLKRALALLGTPYRWGGTGTEGFDCSGLVGYVFRSTLGIELPRVSRDMAKSGEMVERAKLSPGDLVFFGRRGRVDHVGIYVGEGQFVHAPRTGRDVTVSRLDTGYWSGKYMEARRVAGI
ncbi:C40 family peptidase [Luteimonas sp. 50]|uniref:C40 family peptidase n=1 Tax=Cognatiluteimonas sedimenti TaxID=2927791 RepID=A0ABT0A2I2_9GAMM|nr:C40 family peptidase [Lysobacter sedimenti]MCJ0825204.1 C40 family peptidase [Lysobacter sedimenti]